MSAIVIRNSPDLFEHPEDAHDPANFMPFTTRMKVAGELNRLWAEFVTDMHDGPTGGPEVADKFWKFVLAGG